MIKLCNIQLNNAKFTNVERIGVYKIRIIKAKLVPLQPKWCAMTCQGLMCKQQYNNIIIKNSNNAYNFAISKKRQKGTC